MRTSPVTLLIAAALIIALPAVADDGGTKEAGLTDQQFFARVDLSLPGLSKVQETVSRSDWPQARKAWADYLRNRDNVKHFEARFVKDRGPRKSKLPRYPTWAESRVANLNERIKDGTFEPHFQARYDGDTLGLITLYAQSQDSKHAKTAAWLIRDFVERFPYPSELWDVTPDHKGGTPEPWTTLNFGLRTGYSWWNSYVTFRKDPEFTDDTLVIMSKSLIQQAKYYSSLSLTQRDTSNWMGAEMVGLYTIGGMFPECPESAMWRKFAIEALYEFTDWRYLPDGTFFEFSFWYSHLGFNGVQEIYERAREWGRHDEFPEDYLKRAEKLADFTMKLCPPDRTGYFYGQGHSEEASHYLAFTDNLLLRALENYPHRDDFRYVATRGKEGKTPDFSSVYLPYGGICIMRSGWDTSANYLALDAGPDGRASHAHDDANSVALWAYGHPLLYDSLHGRKNLGGAKDHSTVFIDGKTAKRNNNYGSPIDASWESTPEYDFACGVSRVGDRNPVHVRRVLFLKPDLFFVIDDANVPGTPTTHQYDLYWNLLTDQVEIDPDTMAVVTREDGKPNLAIVPLASEGFETQVLPDPENRSYFKNIPARLVTHRTESETLRHVTLLVPLKPGATNPVETVSIGDGNVYSVRFTDGRQFRLKIEPGDHGRIHVEEKGGAGRSVVAGNSPSLLPTEVFTRIRQTASPEDYVRLRSRERKQPE
ncbi:heparinase II/III family protein [Neorhodopirellula pilleata]|nr:heparinase II/III family protein [Neorhodopirellula pilleata]